MHRRACTEFHWSLHTTNGYLSCWGYGWRSCWDPTLQNASAVEFTLDIWNIDVDHGLVDRLDPRIVSKLGLLLAYRIRIGKVRAVQKLLQADVRHIRCRLKGLLAKGCANDTLCWENLLMSQSTHISEVTTFSGLILSARVGEEGYVYICRC